MRIYHNYILLLLVCYYYKSVDCIVLILAWLALVAVKARVKYFICTSWKHFIIRSYTTLETITDHPGVWKVVIMSFTIFTYLWSVVIRMFINTRKGK